MDAYNFDIDTNKESSIIGRIVLTACLTVGYSEVFSYLWHRFASHNSILSAKGISDTHRHHHIQYDRDKNHKAFEDFIWVGMGLSILICLWAVIKQIIDVPDEIVYTSVVVSILFSLWKCFIHAAYHSDKHFMNRFEFFREWKRLHILHHNNPKSNFAISGFTTDKLFGTFVNN